jgi:phosphate transport system permease protein
VTATSVSPGRRIRPLQTRTLSRLTVVGLAGLALAATAGLFAVTGLAGRADFVIVAGLIFAAAQTTISAVVEGRRKAVDRLARTVVFTMFVVAMLPLISISVYTVQRGLARFDITFFTHSMRSIGARDTGGGAYHALLGTIEQVAIATLISVPLGILAAIYLIEFGRGRLADAIRFFVDVMTGIPSVVAGLFVLSFWVLGLGFGFSGYAAALALTVIMLPIVIRSTEEMLRLVPDAYREGSYALGVPKWRTVMRVVLPTALPGILTGVMLAVARIAGETAPVLLTALGFDSINADPFSGPQSSLPLMVFQEAAKPQQAAIDRAWTAALTLILLVMLLNFVARLLSRRYRFNR